MDEVWSDKYREAALKWADLESAAQILEDTKSSILAQKCSLLGDIAVNRAEQTIKSSPEWREHLETIVEARRQANVARVEMEYARMKFSEWQSNQANVRAELRTLGA